MNLLNRAAVTAALALPLAAQDTAAGGAILTIRTADAEAVVMASVMLGGMTEAPELAAAHRYVLRLGADRKPTIDTEPGGPGRWLEISGDPAGLMKAYAKEVARGKQMALGMARLFGGKSAEGLDVPGLVDAVFAFPAQLAQIRITVPEKPGEDGPQAGWGLRLRVAAAQGSTFERVVTQLKPAAAGAPVMASADAMMTMRYAVDAEGLQQVLRPFTDWLMPMQYPDAEVRERVAPLMHRMLEAYTGDGTIVFGEDLGMAMLIGMRGAEALISHPDYADVIGGQQPVSRDMEIEIEANAAEHRGVKMHRTNILNDGPPNPMFPDGEMTTYTGGAGDFLFVAASEAKAKGLVDTVVDGKVQRAPLESGSLLLIDLAMRRMVAAFGGRELPAEAPDGMMFAVGARRNELMLALRFR